MLPRKLFLNNRQVLLRVAGKSDTENVLQFIRNYYYPYDDFTKGNTQSRLDEEIEMQAIDSGASVLAITDDYENKLVGVSLAKTFREDECRKTLKKLQKLSDQRGHSDDLGILIFLEEFKLKSQVCHRFNVDKACYISITGVHDDYKKLQLSKYLVEKNLECAAEVGFHVAFGVTITKMGYSFMISNNFKPFYTMKFVDYKDYRGFNIYSHLKPEATATAGYYKIQNPKTVTKF